MTVWLPLVFGAEGDLSTRDAPVPLGYALYGTAHSNHHAVLARGLPVQNWTAQACCLEYASFTPALWGPRWWQTMAEVALLASKYPARTWLLWNEPNVKTQANIQSFDCIGITKEWVSILRAHGCTWAGMGLGLSVPSGNDAEFSAPWRDWLRNYQKAKGPDPDIWHVHIYATTAQQFDDIYGEWQTWNETEGGAKPTILSEVGTTRAVWEHVSSLTDRRIVQMHWFSDLTESWV